MSPLTFAIISLIWGAVGVLLGYQFSHRPVSAWVYLLFFVTGALTFQSGMMTVWWLELRSRARREHRPVVHFLERVREYVANEPSEADQDTGVAKPVGSR